MQRWSAFGRALHGWYVAAHRKLAWRAAPGQLADPYKVLVSEAMLQQTLVATVEAYFDRFIKRFPTISSLAAAEESEVLHAWQGLGYYRRARHLHRAAQAIVNEHGGRVPGTAEELLKLPGVGRYTAGAIASIAFGQREAIVDGNVVRVLSRVFAIEGPSDEKAVGARIWSLAGRVVGGREPAGDMNQALMELGAMVCTPRSPCCGDCPVRRHCGALAAGRVEELPRRSARKQPVAVVHQVLAIERGGRWLFEQRDERGLWAGLWQLPTCEMEVEESLARWAEERFGLKVRTVGELGCFTHVTTHRRISFEVLHARAIGGRLRSGAGVWRAIDRIADLPMSNAQRKAIAMIGERVLRGES